MNTSKWLFKICNTRKIMRRACSQLCLILAAGLFLCGNAALAATTLADNPLLSTTGQTGNVALALSVEFPTALGSSYTGQYSNTTEYLGYWDANKCYGYNAKIPFYNTGVDDNGALRDFGQSDLHWTVTGAGAGTMNVINNIYPGQNSTSRSLGLSSGAAQNADVTYQTTINIPVGTDLNAFQLEFKLAFDDQIASISVNGQSTGISYPNIDTSASVNTILKKSNSNFVIGSNTLKIVVHNNTGDFGLRVDGAQVTGQTLSDGSYFLPKSIAAPNHVCNAGATPYWSGNLLNWALTQTIDPFRYALSGGYRSADRVGMTILEKAYATGQGGTVRDWYNTALTDQNLIKQSTPFQNSTALRIAIGGWGNRFLFTTTTGIANGVVNDGGVPQNPDPNVFYEMYGRVSVCVPGLLENNCNKYPNGGYKPEGLIQKNAKKLNFAAFGYLLDNDIKRDGGVLRAKMAPVGPVMKISNSTESVNPNPEWSATTGVFLINPDSTDAANSGVSNSGVINYLNKFGLTAKSYKTYDPVGELYYTATRYFKNQGNVAAYTANLDDTKKDGFPVITNWDDPIKNECQANFIIGIGDSNTHADVNLPGTTIQSGNEPALPAQVQNDTSVNSRVATNKVGQLENIAGYTTNLGERYTPWCCSNNGFLMAGVAYDSHTKDIRPNDFKTNGAKTTKQTIATYWLDVLESGDRKDYGAAGMRNQFWLAAKYGGFTVPSGYDTYTANAGPSTNTWDTNNDGDPDNYYRANNPALMISGLTKAFDDIVVKSGKGFASRTTVKSPLIYGGDITISSAYNANDWSGDVIGSALNFTADNKIITSEVWRAAAKLDAQNWSSGRSIATAKCSSVAADGTKVCTGIPFRTATDLLASNQTDLTATGQTAQNVVNYLRGDKTLEDNSNFRARVQKLGDIGNSRAVLVGAPNGPMLESFNLGYNAFKAAYASRNTVAYVGANDGMLHAFDGTPNNTGGNELFAYVPSMLFNGPNNTPATDGLAALTKTPLIHHPYVDGDPVVQDVNFGGNNNDWHTLLVSGLAKGGKGYFALDVTNPTALKTETNLAQAVKWEFTHKDMGYSYGTPLIVKISNSIYSGWVVIVTSGYNNTDGKGYFFVLNAATGRLIAKIGTGAGSATVDSGLASPSALINNNTYTTDAVYAGDLLGNVWRLNIKDFSITQFASLKNIAGQTQPITTKVSLAYDQPSGKRYVLVGTGKMLDDSDIGNTQQQSVYSIADGYASTDSYLTATTLPSGVTFPILRANLNQNVATKTSASVTPTGANKLGWYLDLDSTYIMNVNMAVNADLLSFAANSFVGTTCGSVNKGRLYTLRFATGKSANNIATYNQYAGFFTDVAFIKDASKPNSLGSFIGGLTNFDNFAGGSTPGNSGESGIPGTPCASCGDELLKENELPKSPDPDPPSGLGLKLLNWRDLPTAD